MNKKGVIFWPALVIYTGILVSIFLAFYISPLSNNIKDILGKYSENTYELKKNEALLLPTINETYNLLNSLDYINGLRSGIDFNTLEFNKDTLINNCKKGDYVLWFNEPKKTSCRITDEYLRDYYTNIFSKNYEKLCEELEKKGIPCTYTCDFNFYGTGRCNLSLRVDDKIYHFKKNYSFIYNFTDYFTFIKKLEPTLSNFNSIKTKELKNCLESKKEPEKNIEECYQYILKEAAKKTKIKENLTLSIHKIDDGNLIIIKAFKNNKEIFRTGILEESAPLPITYTLENAEGKDKTINIKIKKPLDLSSIFSFIIIYSDHNFSNNEELNKYLNENRIPKDKDKLGFSLCKTYVNKEESLYYYKDPDVNILTVNKNAVKFNTQDIGIISINETCSNGSQLTKLPDRDTYVFVYAINKENSYFKQGISTKKITPKNLRGPHPLSPNEITIITDGDFDRTFEVKVSGYNDKDLDHYELIITTIELDSLESCYQDTSLCYILKDNPLLKEKNFDILISSDPTLQHSENIIKGTQFSPSLELENNKNYYLYIIPVSKDNKKVLKTNLSSRDGAVAIKVRPTLNKPPHPTLSITQPEPIFINNVLFLKFSTQNNYKVDGLDINFQTITFEDATFNNVKAKVSIDGTIIPTSNGLTKEFLETHKILSFTIDKIYPYTLINNKILSGETYPPYENINTYTITWSQSITNSS